MKTPIFFSTFFLVLFLSFENFAQDSSAVKKNMNRIYIKANLGYGFATGSGQYIQVEEFSDGSASHEVLKTPFSLGKGGKIGASVGYMLNEIIGIELDLSVLAGSWNDAKNILYNENSGKPYFNDQSVKYHSTAYRVNPCLLLTTKNQECNIYGRTGLMISFSEGVERINESVTFLNGGTADGQFNWKYQGGFGIGTTQAVGVTIDYDDYIRLFAEASFINISTTFKKAVRTSYVINGIDQMKTLSTYQKEIVYRDKVTDNSTPNPDAPKEQLKEKWSSDSFGFNMGFIFFLH